MQVISDNNVKLNLEGSKRNHVVNVEHLKPFTGLLANEDKNIVKIIEKLRSRNFDTKCLESRYLVEFNDRHTEWVPTDMVPAKFCTEFEKNVSIKVEHLLLMKRGGMSLV